MRSVAKIAEQKAPLNGPKLRWQERLSRKIQTALCGKAVHEVALRIEYIDHAVPSPDHWAALGGILQRIDNEYLAADHQHAMAHNRRGDADPETRLADPAGRMCS